MTTDRPTTYPIAECPTCEAHAPASMNNVTTLAMSYTIEPGEEGMPTVTAHWPGCTQASRLDADAQDRLTRGTYQRGWEAGWGEGYKHGRHVAVIGSVEGGDLRWLAGQDGP